ncbi:MAG TPA: hypothetical protein VLL72_04475, partial [Kiloniellales bacterium]|nr:hypothetical protein [Kiloniellales bacterium]
MTTMRQLRAKIVYPLMLVTLAIATSGAALAQGRSAATPENATARSFGGGWACDRGYREAEGDCTALAIPE